jgi:hypothetical protein
VTDRDPGQIMATRGDDGKVIISAVWNQTWLSGERVVQPESAAHQSMIGSA